MGMMSPKGVENSLFCDRGSYLTCRVDISSTQLHWNSPKKNTPWCHLEDNLFPPQESHLPIFMLQSNLYSPNLPIHGAKDPYTQSSTLDKPCQTTSGISTKSLEAGTLAKPLSRHPHCSVGPATGSSLGGRWTKNS